MKQSLLDLGGKVAVITGGSRGLGQAIAKGFAAHGADVVIASRKMAACEAVAEEIRVSTGRQALPVSFNAGHWDECDQLADVAYRHFGKVDVLVNNAGISPTYDSLTSVTEELFDKVFSVNLKGAFRLSALIGERMAGANGGSIINVSSLSAVQPTPIAVPYAAAKAALNALTVGIARTYGPKVRVNAIMPGAFFTDISKSWDLQALTPKFEKRIPLKRGAEPDEILGTALYLASDASSYTTGAVISVDGGAPYPPI
jgi:NAD(P)-dependent dehydrogenase (short-subunit alcohol dehydrogenase family)